MADSLVKQIVDSYRTLAGVTNARTAERSGNDPLPCLVFRVYGGRASQEIPTQDLRVQATAYAEGSQEAADLLAEGVRTNLHGKRRWDVGTYLVGGINCDTVVQLPAQDGQGGRVYRAAVSMRIWLRPDQ